MYLKTITIIRKEIRLKEQLREGARRSMAETTVEIVLGKIADILFKEIDSLGEVGDQVESVKRELGRIQSFLRDAKSKRTQNERARHWIKEVRDVAYKIEDAIDEYFVEMKYKSQRTGTFRFSMKYFNLEPWRSLGTKIAKIQGVLREISESKDRYEVCLDQGKEWEPKQHLRRRYALEDIDETEVIGLQTEKNIILNRLQDANLSRRAVISIVGPGGVGKTTLTQMIYKSAKAAFNNHIWLTISQKFSLSDILRKMIDLSSSEPNVQDEGHLIEPMEKGECHLIAKLKFLLSGKRYLVIMDDVWNKDLWVQLRAALPDENNGSRVLITSRFINVATSADPLAPYLLDFLNEKDSVDLLLKKALPFQNPDEICSSVLLEEVVKPLSKKCKGLPLALIVVGGILSTKHPSYHAWKRVLETMDWHSDDGKDCMDVLAMSYEDMPHHLKACFIYFSSFPEDYEISAKHLIRMWTTEGFIPCTASRTMDQTAEDCLDQLVQRCMVQVSSRYTDGSFKNLRVHDLLRDLAVHEAEDDNFITVFSKGVLHQPNRAARRVSLQFCSSEVIIKYINPNTRSFLLFGELLPNFTEFRLLKVLQIEGVWQGIELKGLSGLINLKHLGIRNCKNVRIDSRSFGCLLNLEILDVRGTAMEPHTTSKEMHNLLWKIDTLRHVELSEPVNGPASSVELEHLQTLRWVLVSETWRMKLPRLTNLRRFGIKNTFREWDNVTKVLTTLPSLVSLGIKGDKIPLEIVHMSCRNLQSLYLEGKWSMNLTMNASLFPPHLLKLTLAGSMLRSDPLPELAKLEYLRKLRLLKFSYLGKKLTCLAGQFAHLENFEVSQLTQLEVLEMREESMVKLNYLKICSCRKLQGLPEVHHLTALRDLKLESMPQIQGSGSRAGSPQNSGIPSVSFP